MSLIEKQYIYSACDNWLQQFKVFLIMKTLIYWQVWWLLKLTAFDFNIVYKTDKHNTADAFSRWSDYADEVEKNNCLSILQSKLKVIKKAISELLEFPKEKLNEVDYTRHISDMSV